MNWLSQHWQYQTVHEVPVQKWLPRRWNLSSTRETQSEISTDPSATGCLGLLCAVPATAELKSAELSLRTSMTGKGQIPLSKTGQHSGCIFYTIWDSITESPTHQWKELENTREKVVTDRGSDLVTLWQSGLYTPIYLSLDRINWLNVSELLRQGVIARAAMIDTRILWWVQKITSF